MLEEKKSLLNENKVKIAADAEDAKMLSLNLESLDADTRMIMQTVLYKMLQLHKNELDAADKERVEEEAEKPAYAVTTTP
ncbi:hypothetical protein ZWY2020_021217 [Hordeum vulgare]|nr:hypothetical protein ZWY2020_021217 [Hordeum vulgare]